MRSDDDVRRVFELWNQCLTKAEIARQTGVSRAQVKCWLEAGLDATLTSPMRRNRLGGNAGVPCDGSCGVQRGVPGAPYAYLLGQYLGDGTISETRRGVFRLRIAMCDAYPQIRDETELAIHLVMPDHKVGAVQAVGCSEVYSHSKHWPCLFPQHGRGMKHLRPIELARWQVQIAIDEHPKWLLRGLIHSDGCRVTNWAPRRDGQGRYEYPRYFFSNRSDDIRGIFQKACGRLSIESRPNNRYSISVARRASVALLDSFIGPKR